VVRDIYDRATSPKLGGVRFVDPSGQQHADRILQDERTPDQLASDAFVQVLALGADADPEVLLGSGAPVIRLTVTRNAFGTGTGLARIEGQLAPVSIASAWRLSCQATVGGIVFDESGTALDFGREQRFFTRKQKEALAIMWGGCAFPGCQRPPSWTEAHHIEFWARDGGRTDLADVIPLCRHHHLLCHNNGWEIQRDKGSNYWLIPPIERDPDRKPIPLVSKSAALRDLRRETAYQSATEQHRATA
jgi:hypothetical protein